MDLNSSEWYLLKSEGNETFGPVNLRQLKTWAHEAQISPLDKVSTDQTTWLRAPMVAGLGMDWLVSVTADQLYGPTTLGAVVEFLVHGEINEDTEIINACDGTVHRLGDIAERETEIDEETDADADADDTFDGRGGPSPQRTGIKTSLQRRIIDLETALLEERRALARLEERYKRLIEQHTRITGVPYND